MHQAQVIPIKARSARRTRKDKGKFMCFPFVNFVFFLVR